ncbi:AtpF1 [Desulforapulum autotrophicum HRM2]|uniref:ATP synthase subunit b n=1 Tax=Desulforapulum autotrophicum (strain ATCC 43914 / DSM 3382 / VKM B-1955 / HRM2) TaxID=177437 RepID=C0Q8V4_DESAH|nr:protein AtpF1 [Desulforapulum autotrophicum]ACN14444.1 AtpF1 [Desulforapulum autotrophicum HRM2]
MQIDWFTTGAQVINFLILVWLLKKFLYRPVMETMDRRQQRIVRTLDQAQNSQIQADLERQRYITLQQGVEKEANSQIQRARTEAENLRIDLIAAAKAEAEQARQRWQKSLALEKQIFLEQSTRLFTRQFQTLARQSFQTLAQGSLEQTIIEVFWQKLEQDHQNLTALTDPIQANEPLTVTTAFAPDPGIKEKIQARVIDLFGPGTTLVFEQDKALIMGITLEAGGKKITWDQGHYLDEFTRRLDLALEHEIHLSLRQEKPC